MLILLNRQGQEHSSRKVNVLISWNSQILEKGHVLSLAELLKQFGLLGTFPLILEQCSLCISIGTF